MASEFEGSIGDDDFDHTFGNGVACNMWLIMTLFCKGVFTKVEESKRVTDILLLRGQEESYI